MPRFVIKKGMRLIHKLHRHVVVVGHRTNDGYRVSDLMSGQTHLVKMGTFYSYYTPLDEGGGEKSISDAKRAARERARQRRMERKQQPHHIEQQRPKPSGTPLIDLLLEMHK